MSKLHKDYYIRKCYLERNEVPTQSVMRRKMGSALADVYFKSLSPKLRVIAGLDPPLRGGGGNWYMPPEDLLKGRAILKPVQRKFLNQFSCDGIISLGKKIVNQHRRAMEIQKKKILLESDEDWKKIVVERKLQEWNAVSARERKKNTRKIKQAVHEFSVTYRTSLTKLESLLQDAAEIEMEQIKRCTYDEMNIKLERLQEEQRKQLFEKCEDILETEKRKCKEKFLNDIEKLRTDFDKNISAIDTEKYTALEKLRTILGYQNLACQVYVALKERTECERDIEASKQEHEKSIKLISEQIKIKDDKISSTVEEIKEQKEVNRLWQNKVRHVVKRFQELVKYCLHTMPEQAEFFINMEKLMLMQLCEALDNPRAMNMIEIEEEHAQTDPSKPCPFFLVCDEETRPQIDPNLCQQISSQMAVIVVNKRCIYAACDNLELLGDKLEEYLAGKDLNDGPIDDHDYDMDVPIHCTSSEQLLELKLESSLMQILQDEFLKVKPVVSKCAVCGNHYCFCSPKQRESKVVMHEEQTKKTLKPVEKLKKADILKFTREPKIPSYLDYIRPDKCECAMKAKKHLKEHLPAYMKNVSAFEKVDIPQYEPCDVHELKKLVEEANCIEETSTQAEEKTRNVATQYSDQEFEALYESYSDIEIKKVLRELQTLIEAKDTVHNLFECGILTPGQEAKTARTVKQMNIESPKLEDIFKK